MLANIIYSLQIWFIKLFLTNLFLIHFLNVDQICLIISAFLDNLPYHSIVKRICLFIPALRATPEGQIRNLSLLPWRPGLRSKRRQGQHLQHRGHREAPLLPSLHQATADGRASGRILCSPSRRQSPPLRCARHSRGQLRAREFVGWRGDRFLEAGPPWKELCAGDDFIESIY